MPESSLKKTPEDAASATEEYRRIFAYFQTGQRVVDAARMVQEIREKMLHSLQKEGLVGTGVAREGMFLLEQQAVEMPYEPNLSDPNDLRRYIEYLLSIDVRVALGKVFQMTEIECRQENSVRMAHKSRVMEATYDLGDLLLERCEGNESNAGFMHLRTLLRYMLQRDYHQGTMAAEALCSDEHFLYTDEEWTTELWTPSFQEGDLVLDLGCGPGKTLDLFEQKVGKENVRGIDINPLDAVHDERIRIGIVDASQDKISIADQGRRERLSFGKYFGKAKMVFASLVLDRVANQGGFLMNCKKLLKPGGTLAIGLLLPVQGEDDEPDLTHRLRYVFEPLTLGENPDDDFKLLASYLRELGFVRVMRERQPITDPVTGSRYPNHFLLIAQKGED